jgi:hypothetical protein
MTTKGPYIVTHTLIVRNAEGAHINGTGSRGDLEYAKKLARSYLRIDQRGAASIEVYQYDPAMPWQELHPLATVTLDDEGEGA